MIFHKNKILKFTLYVGLNDQHTRSQQVATKQAKTIIADILKKNGITGATYLKAEGIYTYLVDNKTELENTFKVEILFAKPKQIKQAIAEIKTALNQESIAVTREKIISDLI